MSADQTPRSPVEIGQTSFFQQFSDFCLHTDHFFDQQNFNRNYITTALQDLEMRIQQQVIKSNLNGYALILKLRLLNSLRVLEPGSKKWHEDATSLIAELKSSNYWTEKAVEDRPTSRNITIFAPFPFHMSSIEDSERLTRSFERRTRDASERALSKIIDNLHGTLLTAGRSEFSELIQDRDGLLSEYFPALADIHHEVTDNAYRHALKSPLTNVWLEDGDQEKSFFGDSLYLKVNRLTSSTDGRIALGERGRESAYPNSFHDFILARTDQHRAGRYTGPGRFLSFTYVDNGPGPVRHYRKLAPAEAQNKISTVSDFFAGIASSRPDIEGAGHGFRNMITAARSIRGFLCLRSGASMAFYDGHQNKFGSEVDPSQVSDRGTLLSFTFGL